MENLVRRYRGGTLVEDPRLDAEACMNDFAQTNKRPRCCRNRVLVFVANHVLGSCFDPL